MVVYSYFSFQCFLSLLSASISLSTTSPSTTTTTETVPVSSSTHPTNNPPSDEATTTLVIIVVAVVIMLVVIVVGVLILVVLFRANKKKQRLVINRVQKGTEHIEMQMKQEETTEKVASSTLDQPLYAVIHDRTEHVKCLNPSNEYELVPDDGEYAIPANPPGLVNLSDPMFEEMESNPMYFTL